MSVNFFDTVLVFAHTFFFAVSFPLPCVNPHLLSWNRIQQFAFLHPISLFVSVCTERWQLSVVIR